MSERLPSLLFEIKIDLRDVRSECRISENSWYRGQWITGREDENWTRDMVSLVDPSDLSPIRPRASVDWPDWGDEEIFLYLTRFYRPQIWRNHDLRLFATHEESRQEFMDRCREALMPERLSEMKKLREVLLHRFFEMEHRLITDGGDDELDDDVRLRRTSAVGELFSDVREDLSRIFGEDDYRLLGEDDLKWQLSDPDSQDRLRDLRADLVKRYNAINSEIEERASQVEPYLVPASRSSFEIVTRSFLWQ